MPLAALSRNVDKLGCRHALILENRTLQDSGLKAKQIGILLTVNLSIKVFL